MRRTLALAFALGLAVAQGVGFKTYCNERFGFCLEYPSTLRMQPPPENGDGRTFKSADGRVEMRAYGSLNALDATLEAAFGEAKRRGKVTYSLLKSDFFVVSGTDRGNVFFEKTFLRSGTFTTFVIAYPTALKGTYDPLVSRIAKSFKPGS